MERMKERNQCRGKWLPYMAYVLMCLLCLPLPALSAVNEKRIWTGGVNTRWDSGDSANWEDISGAPGQFFSGDWAVFDERLGMPGTITIVDSGVTASQLDIFGGSWSFAGGDLKVDAAFWNGDVSQEVEGKLNLFEEYTTVYLKNDSNFVGGISIDGGYLSVSGSLSHGDYSGDIVNNGALLFNQSTDQILRGVISGDGYLDKDGTGVLTFAGANTYTGTISVFDGGLIITGSLGGGDHAGDIFNNGALTFDQSTDQILRGVISGNGGLTKAGKGVLTLTGEHTYTGATIIRDGGLTISGSLGGGNYAGDIANNGRLTFNQSGNQLLGGEISGGGSLIKEGAGNLTLFAGLNRSATSAAAAGDVMVNGGRLDIGGSGNFAKNVKVNTGETLGLFAGGTMLSARALTFTGSGGLDIIGTTSDGPAVIATTNGVSGFDPARVTVSGNTSVDFLFLSSELANSGKDIRIDSGLRWNMTDGSQHGTFTLTNTEDIFTVGQVLADNTAANSTGWDGRTLTKAGDGTLTLAGANTYSGGTKLNTGRISLGNGSALGSGQLTMADGTTLGFAADALSVANPIAVTGAVTIDTGNKSATLSGLISGNGNDPLTKTGSGTLTLANSDNPRTGGVIVTEGVLAIADWGSINPDARNAVSGAGSRLESQSNLHIGNSGSGALNITDGAMAEAEDSVYLGYDSGSSGQVTVNGVGSLLSARSDMVIGNSGSGALNVTDGARATAQGSASLGHSAGSSGRVTVDGAGSQLLTVTSLYVGESGSGVLNVTDGAKARPWGYVYLGYASGSSGLATVSGADSELVMPLSLYVGESGVGVLNVTDGATAMTDASVYLGDNQGSSGQVTVSGAGSRLSASSSIYVGVSGVGVLNVTDGASATAGNAVYLGYVLGSNGQVTVNGAGSSLHADSSIAIGVFGSGTLNVTDGATATAGDAVYLGYEAGSSGRVRVSGADSLLSAVTAISVGSSDGSGSGLLAGTGRVSAYTNYSTGTVTVYSGGVLSAGDMPGEVGTLTFGQGPGAIRPTSLVLQDGATLRVDANSTGADLIMVYGDATVAASASSPLNIELGSLRSVSNAAILSALLLDADATALAATRFTVDGAALSTLEGHSRVRSAGATLTQSGVNLVLTATFDADSEKMTWTGAKGDSTWNTVGSVNWQDSSGTSGQFLSGDWAVFDDGSGGAGDITISESGVTASQLDISAGVWSFAGGDLNVDAASWINAAPQEVKGKLNILGADTEVFLENNSYFAGGISLDKGSLTVSGSLGGGDYAGDIINNGALTFDQATDQTLRGVISGDGGLTKAGTGVLTLTGANTYTGATIVRDGGLSVSGSLGGGDYAGDIVNNGALTFDQATNQTLRGVISGDGGLIKAGTGVLTLTGANTYTGATIVRDGGLSVSDSLGGGDYAGNIVNNGRLTFNQSGNQILSGEISGGGSLIKEGAGGLTLSAGLNRGAASAAAAGDVMVNGGRLDIGGSDNMAGNVSVNSGGTLGLTARGTMLSAVTLTFTGSGGLNITGATSDDAAVITTTNGVSGFDPARVTFSGSMDVDFLSPLAELANSGKDIRIDAGLRWNMTDGSQHGTFTLTNAGDTFTVGQALADNTAPGATGWDGRSLTKAGNGILVLSGTNTYTGTTTVSGGTLKAGAANAFSGSSDYVLGSAATLDLGGYDQRIGSLQGDAGAEIILGSGSLAVTQTADSAFGGALSGDGGLIKEGAGKLTLSGDSSAYTGAITQYNGTLSLQGITTADNAFTQHAGFLTTANGVALADAIFKGTVTPSGTLKVTSAVFDGATVNLGLLREMNAIAVGGNASFAHTTVDIDLSGAGKGTYTLIAYTSVTAQSGVTVNAANAGVNRGGFYFDPAGAALKYDVISGSISLTWNGTPDANAWNSDVSANTNWTAGHITTWFKDGDNVTFAAGAAGKSVAVDAGGVRVGSMKVNGDYTFSGGTITAAGEVTVTGHAVLGLAVGSTEALNAASVILGSSGRLNITGYTPDERSPYNSRVKNTLTLIATSNGVSGFSSDKVTVAGQTSADFLSAIARLGNDGKDVVVETALNWYLGNAGAHGTFTVAEGQTFTLGAALADETGNNSWDGKSLTKKGAGVLILTGADTYSGATTVSGGTLQIGNGGTGGSIASRTVSVGSGAVLAFNRSDAVTYDGAISGAGSLRKQGAGDLTLSGASTYSGGTAIDQGLLRLTGASAAGTGGVDTAAGTALELAFAGTFGNGVSGNGGLSVDAGAGQTVILAGTNTYTGMTTVLSGGLGLGSDLTASGGLTLYGGTTFALNGHTHALGGKTLTVFGDPTYDGDLSAPGAELNFILTGPVTDTMLSVTGRADIDGSRVNLGVSGNTRVAEGTTLSLLRAAKGLDGSVTQGDGAGILRAGATIVHTVTLATTANELTATVGGGSAAQEAKALPEGNLAGLALALQGADLAAGQGLGLAVRAARQSDATGPGGYALGGFAATSGGLMRYHTGSHMDMHSVNLLTGLAFGADLTPGRLTLGAFFEYGNGSYDTHNSFSNAATVKGEGTTWYTGGGILGRMDFAETGPGRIYAEATARAGRLHNDYDNSDLRDSRGRKAKYESSSAYYGAHLGLGYIWNLTEKADLDLHAKYFWTRQEGDGVSLSTGERVRFKGVDSHRTRAGARFSYALNDYIKPYVGAAWEREFDGKARATSNGHPIDAPHLKGNTGIGEIGLSITPNTALPLSFDLGVQGYTGKREGVTGSLQIRIEF